MNWGKGIAITFIIFCTGMIAVVVRSFQEDVDLVTEEYYREELAYQDRIDRSGEVAKSGRIVVVQTAGAIRFTFPADQHPTGKIHFYKPDNPDLDQIIDIQSTIMDVSKSNLVNGKYRIKVTWESDGTSFYQEEILFI